MANGRGNQLERRLACSCQHILRSQIRDDRVLQRLHCRRVHLARLDLLDQGARSLRHNQRRRLRLHLRLNLFDKIIHFQKI